jgi:hypothetical protein
MAFSVLSGQLLMIKFYFFNLYLFFLQECKIALEASSQRVPKPALLVSRASTTSIFTLFNHSLNYSPRRSLRLSKRAAEKFRSLPFSFRGPQRPANTSRFESLNDRIFTLFNHSFKYSSRRSLRLSKRAAKEFRSLPCSFRGSQRPANPSRFEGAMTGKTKSFKIYEKPSRF